MNRLERSPELQEAPPSNFLEMLEARWAMGNFVCVGLDSQYDRIPEMMREGLGVGEAMFRFNKEIIDATSSLVCAYKPNLAFYLAKWEEGLTALRRTTEYAHRNYPGIPVILDAKWQDIGNTNLNYREAGFSFIGADAVTVHPFLGHEALQPFLDEKDKGFFVLCRTSNLGAGEFQDLIVKHPDLGEVPFYQVVAYQVANEWNANENCGLVVGATYPEELARVREIAPDLPLLIPGIGKQGGEVERTVNAGKGPRGLRSVINSSRGIIFASSGADFAEAARTKTEALREMINQYR